MGWEPETGAFQIPPLSFMHDGSVVEISTEQAEPAEEDVELPEAS